MTNTYMNEKIVIMMITAAFGFSLLLFEIGTGAIDDVQTDIKDLDRNNEQDRNAIRDDLREIDKDVTQIKQDVAFIKGRLNDYWPARTNSSLP